jgi:hypothetical protein
MGEAEIHEATGELIIHSTFVIYGDAATDELAKRIASDISMHWNEPAAAVVIHGKLYNIRFNIDGVHEPRLTPETVWYNDNPRMNYFRIEDALLGNISYVDGIGSNTGCFQTANLLQTSTTAAHEYGHTLGLVHPSITDIRGGLEPSIMYPRGTLCDAHLQYDPRARPSEYGGFLDPKFRRVTLDDIKILSLHKLRFDHRGFAQLGEFSSFFHQKETPDISGA